MVELSVCNCMSIHRGTCSYKQSTVVSAKLMDSLQAGSIYVVDLATAELFCSLTIFMSGNGRKTST